MPPIVVLLVTLLAVTPAFAQLEKVNSTLASFQTALYGIGGVLLTIAMMWSGYKMAFQQAKWAEVANVIYGCLIAGSASVIVGWFMR